MSSSESETTQLLIQTQKECIASMKLNINLLDDKVMMAVQAAETWKNRYDALEKQALELQSKYLALINPQQPATSQQQVE